MTFVGPEVGMRPILHDEVILPLPQHFTARARLPGTGGGEGGGVGDPGRRDQRPSSLAETSPPASGPPGPGLPLRARIVVPGRRSGRRTGVTAAPLTRVPRRARTEEMGSPGSSDDARLNHSSSLSWQVALRQRRERTGGGRRMNYDEMSAAEFDAVATGELVQYATAMEEKLDALLCDFFNLDGEARTVFEVVFLRRPDLSLHGKIGRVESLCDLLPSVVADDLRRILTRIRTFKEHRNLLAHGRGAEYVEEEKQSNGSPRVAIERVTHSGKVKLQTITPESHRQLLKEGDEILKMLDWALEQVDALRSVDPMIDEDAAFGPDFP